METICECQHMNDDEKKKKTLERLNRKSEHNPITVVKVCNENSQQKSGEKKRKHLNPPIVLNDNAQLLFEEPLRKSCRTKAKNAIQLKNTLNSIYFIFFSVWIVHFVTFCMVDAIFYLPFESRVREKKNLFRICLNHSHK